MSLSVLALVLAVACAVPRALHGSDDRPVVVVAVASQGQLGGGHRVVLRSFGAASVVQVDVIAPEGRVVSLVSSFGTGHRAVCDAVFLDRGKWFGSCDVYDLYFSSAEELFAEIGRSRGWSHRRRYAFAAGSERCGPTFLGTGPPVSPASSSARDRLALAAALEVARWEPADARSLWEALALARSAASPNLGQALERFFHFDSPSLTRKEQLVSVDQVPDDILVVMDYERTRGLGEWLENVAAKLP